ncbi:protein GET1 [Dioszegia hungarica]|uniref:Protein GET1 n=1 Tax=Dioszegia hungarica TaxID=4972 RepID=A0AA38HC26_9TREE|nr:protein GET1 [Dioszegia hungarica]KAI9637645.1 protein GET1 [Dioszegia hungarica]
MPGLNLAALILLVVTLTQIVSWVGKSVLQELAFSAYSRVLLSSPASKQRTLRKQVLADKAALSKTSSQDEFAKWAKLRRKLDKGLADLEAVNTQITSAKSSFSLRFNSLLWFITTGSQLFLVWWYRRQPVFYLPSGWAPGIVGWMLSFPSAPKGSVSSAAWAAVCKRVLLTAEEVVKDLLIPGPAAPAMVPPFAAQPGGAPAEKARPSATIHTIESENLD